MPRNLLLAAAILAIIASGLILTSTSEVREWMMDEEGAYEVIYQETWYQNQGSWGVTILIIFAALYSAPYLLLRAERKLLSGVFALFALVLTWLAGFSIGFCYLPAAGALILSYIVTAIIRLRQKPS